MAFHLNVFLSIIREAKLGGGRRRSKVSPKTQTGYAMGYGGLWLRLRFGLRVSS